MKKSLGVIIPIYNAEKYLRECLKSIVEQTVPFDEVIMVNDGSCDYSQNICEEYIQKYSYMKLINQENQGPSAARNRGMMYCRCEYIVFLDADDYIVPQMVEVLKERLCNQDIFCYAANVQNEIDGVEYPNVYLRSPKICKKEMTGMEFFSAVFPHNYIVSPCLSAYKKTFLDQYDIWFTEGMYYEDDFFSVQLVCNAQKVECISDMLYVRRYRSDSTMTGALDERKCADKLQIQLKIWDYIKVKMDDRWERLLLKKFILHNISRILLMDKQCQCFFQVKHFEIEYWERFAKDWERIFDIEELSFVDCFLLMKAYKKLMCIKGEIYLSNYTRARKRFESEQFRVLDGLCLGNQNMKIGIYGIGKHTAVMLKLYEKVVGKVECPYYFIVSNLSKKSVLTAEGRMIVSCDNIPEDMDLIIISSLIYQNDMIENLKKTGIALEKIYCLYDENAVCDLCTMVEIE